MMALTPAVEQCVRWSGVEAEYWAGHRDQCQVCNPAYVQHCSVFSWRIQAIARWKAGMSGAPWPPAATSTAAEVCDGSDSSEFGDPVGIA